MRKGRLVNINYVLNVSDSPGLLSGQLMKHTVMVDNDPD